MKSPTKEEIQILKQKVEEKVKKSPKKAAKILSSWMKEKSSKQKCSAA